MSIKFLSPEYMVEATRLMNADEDFRSAVGDLELAMQLVVTDPPDEGDFSYYIRISDGGGEMSRGSLDDPDATLRHTYKTAVGISRGEINNAAAFMTGKLKVSGNVAKLMRAQGPLQKLQSSIDALDVEY